MTSRDPTRLRQGLNPLTTSLGAYSNQLTTPMSAVSMTSSHITSAQTPGSTIQPYNPQEWGAEPATMAHRGHQFISEPQASPPPPPPYSPPRSQQQRPMSTVFDQVQQSTPTPPPRLSTSVHRPSPEPQIPIPNPSFPPPPGGRGSSRERRFGLPSLRTRRDVDRNTNTSSPDPYPPPMPHARQSMILPSSFHLAAPERGEPSFTGTLNYGPPAARRAASAGAIETPTSARSRSGSQTRWEPGMPLPPPPPGPPPSNSRSQSVQPLDRATVPIISPPTRRRPAINASTLGPVPPTPADWVDSDHPPLQPMRGRSPGLVIDTTSASGSTQPVDSLVSSSSSAGGLNRQKAVRLDKTIIQRRNESRTRQGVRNSIDERSQPTQPTQPSLISDIVVPNSSTSLARRLNVGKSTPRSGQLETPGTGDSNHDSRNSTPRALPSAKMKEAETPPFSPFPPKQNQYGSNTAVVAPKALPTPPPHTRSASNSRARESSRPPSSSSIPVSKHLVVTQTAEQFATGTIERFQAFAAKEATAGTDADRVRLFADFIVNESRIRRERYSSAIGAMGSEIFDLTRDLFRPMVTQTRRDSNTSQDQWTPASSDPTRSRKGSMGSNFGEGTSHSAPGSASIPVSPSGGPAPAVNWSGNYMPSLSPILSMSVSDNHDGSSRGRPPSRWWEVDSQGDPSARLERSKRESKYMGVSKTQWVEEDQNTASYGGPSEQGSSSEYPPEKTGWHDQEPALTPQPSTFSGTPMGSTVDSTPTSVAHRDYMDVSRLVTMPPPYPRHHPAVNNNHPELTSIRTSVRSLSEISEVKTTKEKFEVESTKRREEFSKTATERRQALRANLQQEINTGNISYADAGVIEADAQTSEISKKKEAAKAEYELFQTQVVVPLNELLTERITRATDLFEDLSRRLFDDGRIDADIPQEEGDDRPELLEKLTLLKWIFEARETLHRANYDLLSERNSRYCEVVVTPYRLSGNTEKLKSAEAFFAEDSAKREYAYAHEVLNRAREVRGVIEEAVTHGVALQLSAFWDIAPPLCDLLETVPLDLEGFNIQIPPAEFEENPVYRDHPMQYLFSLVLHSEKSTYQFIEAHTNLLCLLHEVKEAVANAKGKVLETQTEDADGKPISTEQRKERAQHMRQVEERRLTEDLKEKVRVVQDQWNSALGEDIKSVKERLGEWLLQTGGWDESLEDGGVGGV
ncbi:Fc.00g060850.m01.CDS01 [Cosmosporella sp. VM-42]